MTMLAETLICFQVVFHQTFASQSCHVSLSNLNSSIMAFRDRSLSSDVLAWGLIAQGFTRIGIWIPHQALEAAQ
jgi:hypothetical protein